MVILKGFERAFAMTPIKSAYFLEGNAFVNVIFFETASHGACRCRNAHKTSSFMLPPQSGVALHGLFETWHATRLLLYKRVL